MSSYLVIVLLLTGCSFIRTDSTECNPDFVCPNTQEDEWTFLGLEEESIFSIAVNPCDPSEIFAGTTISAGPARIYRSRDCGENWTLVYSGGSTYHGIVFDPADPNMIYAWRYLVRSRDGGESWERIRIDGEHKSVNWLTIHPHDPALLFTSVRGGWNGGRGRFLRSNDRGSTWVDIPHESRDFWGLIAPIFIHPVHTNIKLIGEHTNGLVYRKKTGENIWEPVFDKTTTRLKHGSDFPERIWLLSHRYRSRHNSGPLYYSDDWGRTWTAYSQIDTSEERIYFDVHIGNNENLYVATSEGVLIMQDETREWINQGIGPGDGLVPVNCLTADPSGVNLFAGTDRGVYVKFTP